MAAFPLPAIAESDFPAFKARFKGDLGETFAAWQAKNEAHYQELLTGGHDVRLVTVSFLDFDSFCARHGYKMDQESLRRFADSSTDNLAQADAADAFAAQARKSALMPERDGLHVFSELAQRPKKAG